MTDKQAVPNDEPQATNETPAEANAEQVAVDTPTKRVFVIGSTKIVEDASMVGKSIDDIKALLETSYPEVKTATVAEKVENGTTYVQFSPKPGRKG